jgi:hypothetical protein
MYSLPETLSTTMMKVGARLEESRSYLRRANVEDTLAAQKEQAWQAQWFGFLPEQIFETLMFTLHRRYGAYPECLRVLKRWQELGLDAHDYNLLVHLHIQLTEPFYRWATGVYFYARYHEGFDEMPSPILARELKQQFEKDLSSQSYLRLSQGILSTARDVGLLKGKNTKSFAQPLVSLLFFGYLVHVLSVFKLPMGGLPDSPFVRSVFRDENKLRSLLREGQQRDWWEFSWAHGVFALQTRAATLEEWFEGAMA